MSAETQTLYWLGPESKSHLDFLLSLVFLCLRQMDKIVKSCNIMKIGIDLGQVCPREAALGMRIDKEL